MTPLATRSPHAPADRAQGILMAKRRCITPEEAFEAAATLSQNSNVPLRDVAGALVDQHRDH